MSDNVRECGNCEYWLKRSDRAGEAGGGYCVRFPPFAPSQYRFSYSDGTANPDSEHLNDAWPMVHQQSWCGEFKPREASPIGRTALTATNR